MTTEQREAIDRLRRGLDDIWFATLYSQEEMDKDIDTVLSLIKEQQEKIEKKDRIINEQLKENVQLQKELNEENKRCMILANNDKFKEQVIDLMAEYIATLDIEEDICANIENDNCDKMAFGECEDCIKQYFAGLVEKE